MRPALPLIAPEPLKILLLGVAKFSVLKILKNSARNWSRSCSLILVSFDSEISALKKWGPRKVFLPTLPKVPTGCSEKQLGLNHSGKEPRIGWLLHAG